MRLSCGIIGGLLCGHCVSRSETPTATADSPPAANQPEHNASCDLPGHSIADQSDTPTRPRIATNVAPIPTYAPSTDSADSADSTDLTHAVRQASGTAAIADPSSAVALENEIEQASIEMRQLDRLELPQRGEVAWRLHDRLCGIGDRLLEFERSPIAIPRNVEASMPVRRNDLTDNRDLIRSLLAAIAVAPEKSAFMAKASRERMAADGTTKPNQLIIVGDLKRIKESDRAWFFQLNDPFNASRQHMVRVDRTRLTQRIPIGSRVVALGKTVPHEADVADTPMIATELYAVRQTNN